MVQELERSEPCPDCGNALAITPARLKRGRARCPRCWLDVKLESTDVGDGPERTSAYLAVLAPALSPPAQLRVERDARQLAIFHRKETHIARAAGGLALGGATVLLAGIGAIPVLAAGLLFTTTLAGGFVLASREETRFALVVERGVVRINGTTVEPALDDDRLALLTLSSREKRWLREVVAARVAGDLDEI
jgi:hypothetical protein